MTFKTTDPFFLLKGEIKTLLPNLGAHYDHWEELIQTTNTANNDEFSWTQKELLKGINDVNWYCSKLEITIKKVSENPDHYKIDQEELSKRKKFLKESKKEIKSIQTKMENTKLLAKVNNDKKKLLLEKSKKQKQDNKYQRLDQAIEMDNQRFINEEFQEYDLIEREQNGELDAIHGTITRVKEMGNVIGEEIDEHNKMFDDLSDDMDAAKGKLKSAMKKSKKLLNSKDRGKMCTIFILIIVLIVLLIIVFQ
ncbi:hypothetical protein M0813_17534 [Anaeramoeba flamelloides]|uniref:t-SNARE coiled-coil homology domain-containing protein n=1 Tax=Anaeramoeba flamelloides TaxID=1746091 RepID=A0AAV7YVA4_9EUKA|nr:hypothetical protein M0812_22641 [Anaeramoeba flamelloides]KAJ6248567.1 hypothetical protein M0813_17534 [Anaeramoeba flamelloides]